MNKQTQRCSPDYDLIIVGAGIAGIIMLRQAVKAKLKVLLLEKSSSVGGLWRDLPDWQDIQSRKEDWTLNALPIHSEMRSDICANIQAWVDKYRLHDYLQFNQRVQQTTPTQIGWKIQTQDTTYQARYLILATGAHNRPLLPKITRENVCIPEFHSFNFLQPKQIKDKSVTVVGSGASALDLLDLCFIHGAKEVHWVYRSPKWFFPTDEPKYSTTQLRIMAKMQAMGKSSAEISTIFQKAMNKRYTRFGLEAIRPNFPFDFAKHQLFSGRAVMIKNFSKIIRHPQALSGLKDNRVFTQDENFVTDLVLYGTGYEVDLSYTGLAKLKAIKTPQELALRCGTLALSLDYPNLFFMAIPALDTSGTTPVVCAVLAKSIAAHICGKTVFPKTVVSYKVLHWDYIHLMAQFDHFNYWPWLWKLKYKFKAWYYQKFPERSLHFD